MIAWAMIFGMLQLVRNIHQGAGRTLPMAQSVIGGPFSSTILTPAVVPVVLTDVDGFRRLVSRLFANGPEYAHKSTHPHGLDEEV